MSSGWFQHGFGTSLVQLHDEFGMASAGRSPAVVRLSIDRIEKNIESIESKITKIFKRPKNREDGSDFDDFWTESIVSTQSIFSKIFERTKNYRIDRIDRFDRSIDRSIGSIDGRHVYVANIWDSTLTTSPKC